ncbi:unnamed protein product [Mytilus edulis]|uniref:Helicase C-terminal domain-containing protein n=1 Tax=Mytilus edulis TaxID=6550 RepID=A0A8S3TR51_MYTED|nr:unnamed protein product [Mytilus edulis]
MVSELQSTTPKTIVYCQNLRQYETLYIWLMEELESLAYLNGVVNINNRMIAMYHSRTDESSMHRILSDFKNSESTTKLIFATVAFRLGIDIPNISIVVCWGVSSSAMTFCCERVDGAQKARINGGDQWSRLEMFEPGLTDSGLGAQHFSKLVTTMGIPWITTKTIKRTERETKIPMYDVAKDSCLRVIEEDIECTR